MFKDDELHETHYCEGCLKLQKQLQEKEQECEELKREIAFGNNGKLSDKIRAIVFKNLNNENLKYKQTLDEIEEFCFVYSNNYDTYETVYKHILDIINKAKEQLTTEKVRNLISA